MSGPDDARVVWIGEEAPREEARRSLDGWARARGMVLVEPATTSGAGYDPTVVERVERELERAREAVAALDADLAERALARAEAELRVHPELPNAAWLRAEVLRGWSSRWMRVEPREPELARAAWQDASALDDGRTAGVGETAHAGRPASKQRLVLRGGRGSGAVLRVDGRARDADASGEALVAELDLAPGEHHVLVQLDARTLVASWVAVSSEPSTVELVLPDAAACGVASLSRATREGEHVRAPGVGCRRWVAAVPGPRPGAILVARCAGDVCGPLLPWSAERAPGPAPAPAVRPGWPSWATWVMVGVGAAAGAAVGLVASGAFESRPVEPRFVAGGVRNE